MNIGKISISNIRHKPLSSILSIILLAFGVGIIIMLMGTSEQLKKQFVKNISGIDMVVGAKGSPLQLILSSVYHIDAPTGNINYSEFQKLAKNPMIETAIPLAYGDNYEGYRIVGTTPDYITHYKADLLEGKLWENTGEVVLGAQVAEFTKRKIGDEFYGSHGTTNSMEQHSNMAYKIVGILHPTGTVIDKLILSDISSVWAVHDHPEDMTETDDHDHQADMGEEAGHLHEGENHEELHNKDREITAGLIAFKTPMGNFTIPRMVNQNTDMQAALPAIEVNRLFSLMGTGVKTLRILALLIVILSALSVFISLWQSLKERKYELALLRSMGASGLQLFLIVLIEGMVIALIGYIMGMIAGKLGIYFISQMTAENYQYSLQINWFTTAEMLLLPATLMIGFIASLLPAIQAYRTNISKVLSDA